MRIDLNADLGEGFGIWQLGDDLGLLPYLTSANVACGFHAGDASIMQRVCLAATEQGVRIGAQVGYRDLAGFGRRAIVMEPAELAADILYQIGALQMFATASGDRVRYVKPHGALYNTAMVEASSAATVVSAVARASESIAADLAILGLPESAVHAAAERQGVRFVAEAFADRGYLPTGQLVPRSVEGALLTDSETVTARAVGLAMEHNVIASDGSPLTVHAESLCLHGDTPGAVELARSVHEALTNAHVTIASFT